MSATILVIDDSLMVRQQVDRALSGAGFIVIEAGDGAEALKKLEAAPQTRLVVCDVNMPQMNGLEFLERLIESRISVPVVMLTTEGQPELIARAKALGAKGWIVKPFKPELLVAAAKKLTASAA
jgi:two-component system chemotaxis response regulator CheY